MNVFPITCKRLHGVFTKNVHIFRLQSINKVLPKCNRKILIGLVPVIPSISAQSELKEEENGKLSSSENKSSHYNESVEEKSPWERVWAIYKTDEFGNSSKELTASLQATFMAAFVGFVYGGILRSRTAYIDFMERNQATIFENHLDAKRRMQNHVTMHFSKGAISWAWRLSLFTGGFMILLSSFQAYRGTTNLKDYALSGTVVGALIRVKFGPPAIIIGGVLGGILGFLGGLSTQSVLNIYGVSHDDVLAFQYEVDQNRLGIMRELRMSDFEQNQVPKEILSTYKSHDEFEKKI